MSKKKDSSKFNWKQKLIILALVIITVAFVFTGIYLVFDSPSYENHCFDKRAVPMEITTEEECTLYEGTWEADSYCDMYSECSAAYETQNSQFRFQVFITSFIIGAIVLISAIFIPIPILSASMMGSGIFILIISLLQYWEDLGEIYRFLILGITLVVLIYIAIKKFNK
ncbi:hypothetical protein HOC01_01570 [archaeon]|jgi:hypothetical protein|nr:hypothetical protein [archaeon]MBT6697992.1 hypothetical protein [archaeon]